MDTVLIKSVTLKWPLSYAHIKRAGWMMLLAVCKLALLLAMLETAGHTLESNSETFELISVETALSLHRDAPTSRIPLAKNLAGSHLGHTVGCTGSRAEPGFYLARATGHRLPNGLCAPMQC